MKMLQVNFIMIYVICKISVLFTITRILYRFLGSIIEFYFFKKDLLFFSQHLMMTGSRLEEYKKILNKK